MMKNGADWFYEKQNRRDREQAVPEQRVWIEPLPPLEVELEAPVVRSSVATYGWGE